MREESTLVGDRRHWRKPKYGGARTLLLHRNPEAVFQPFQLERTILLLLLPMFAVACIAAAWANISMGTATWFERYQLVPMGAVFIGLALWCYRLPPTRVHRVRIATLIAGPGIILERFVLGTVLVFQEGYSPDHLGALSPWVILSACLFVFFIPGRRALQAGFVYYAVVAGLIAAMLLVRGDEIPEFAKQELLVAYLVATPCFLIMMAAFSRVRLAYGTALTKAEDFEDMAMQDMLTGLFNRRGFAVSMRRARSRQRRKKTPVSLIVCDVDRFKWINDLYGHNRGDDVLKKIAGVIVTTLRRTDEVVRWGGEEFLILLEETPLDQAADVAERLRIIIEGENMLKDRPVTMSFGVTELCATEDDATVIGRADQALYEAKESGRNRVVVVPKPYCPSDPSVVPIAELVDDTTVFSG